MKNNVFVFSRRLLGFVLVITMIISGLFAGSITLVKAQSVSSYHNLALGKTYNASSVYNDSKKSRADKAFDNDIDTRWSAAKGHTNNEWVEVDFGEQTTYNKVIIREINYKRVTSFILQSSDDGINYTDIPGTAGTNIGEEKIINFEPVTARYLRLFVHEASGEPTINEIEVYNTLEESEEPEEPEEPEDPEEPEEPQEPEKPRDSGKSKDAEKPKDTEKPVEPLSVADYVKQFYTIALFREADEEGLNFFVNKLKAREMTVAQTLEHIVLGSPEFMENQIEDGMFIELLYKLLFNRKPDSAGMNYWFNKLKEGYSRRWVIANMLGAPTKEFDRVCEELGLIPGRIHTNASDLPIEQR